MGASIRNSVDLFFFWMSRCNVRFREIADVWLIDDKFLQINLKV